MFHHIKDLQFDAGVSERDPRFASILLEQFGGANGELKAAMQYFVQAFGCRRPYPQLYDMLMDIATEEFSHLEIVGATITMLLDGIPGELKNAAERCDLMQLLDGSEKARDAHVQAAFVNPQFFIQSGGGPTVTDSQGNPWSGTFVQANGDPTVDLRSDIAAESRAKITYEYLMQFTSDPEVLRTLDFLMSREIAHFKMFEAALATIDPNFPPGVLQGDALFDRTYYNGSNGENVRGPWNQGRSRVDGEEWNYIENPVDHVRQTHGLRDESGDSAASSELGIQLSRERSRQVTGPNPPSRSRPLHWQPF